MHSLVFICPYFGKLPQTQMKYWLYGCNYNPTIKWYIFTDDRTQYEYPSNVKVFQMTLDDFSNLASKKLEISLQLCSAYKLCDFKPAYGKIFEDYIEEYDCWGHCDISDTIFGDLRSYLTEEILSTYEKILFLGHMTVYKNEDEINNRFKLKTNSGYNWYEILSDNNNRAFDELTPYSINNIYSKYGFSFIRLDYMYCDVSPEKYSFQCSSYDSKYNRTCEKDRKQLFLWEKGHLFHIVLNRYVIKRREIGYVHFQKRKMNELISEYGDIERFLILPNGFKPTDEEINLELLIKYSKDRWIYPPFFKLKWKNIKYRINQLLGMICNYGKGKKG